MQNNKLYYVLKDVVERLVQEDYQGANDLLLSIASQYESDKEIYPNIRDTLYDLAFLHKDFLESGLDPSLKSKTRDVISDIKDFYRTLGN